jgi:hypothetical protein
VLVPALIVFLTIRSESWYGFFGLLFYAVGAVISQFRLWIFLPIPLGFTFWYWYTYGMGPKDYVFIYTVCLLAGVAISEASNQFSRFVKKVLPEQMHNIEYNEKVEELNRRLERYKVDHPNEKLTPEIVEKIRTDIFFD